jgi:hypothetical protein
VREGGGSLLFAAGLLEVEVHLLLLLLLVVVALLEGLDESEDGVYLVAVGLLHRTLHIALHRLEFRELENQFGQICVKSGVPLSSLRKPLLLSGVSSWWSYMKFRMMVSTEGFISRICRVEFF